MSENGNIIREAVTILASGRIDGEAQTSIVNAAIHISAHCLMQIEEEAKVRAEYVHYGDLIASAVPENGSPISLILGLVSTLAQAVNIQARGEAEASGGDERGTRLLMLGAITFMLAKFSDSWLEEKPL